MTDHELETKAANQPPEKPQKENFTEFPGGGKDVVKEFMEKQEKEAVEFKQGKDAVKGELNEKTKFEAEKNIKAEGKNEFKDEVKEGKEKSEKNENKEGKNEFKEDKDAKPEHESKLPEKPIELIEPFSSDVGRAALLEHAEALEGAARVLRHFIEQAERPDLRRGALHNEPDQVDE